jgi:ATP-binding cassette subfamily B protein
MEQKKALSSLKKYRFKVCLAPILKLVECVIELASPFLVRYIIDKGIANNDMPYVLMMGGILLGLAFLAFGFTIIAQYLSAKVSSSYGYDLRKDLFHQASILSSSELNEFGPQKCLTLINNDSFSMQNGVNMFMRLLLRPPFLIIGCLILSFLIDYRVGLVFFGVLLASSLLMALIIKITPKKYAAVQSSLDEISTLGNDALKGARPIRAFNKEKDQEQKFLGASNTYEKETLNIARCNAFLNPLTFCFINIGMILVVYLGGLGVSGGYLTTGQIVSLISYLTLSLTALTMFSRLIVSLNRALASKKRIDAFLSIKPSIANVPNATKPVIKNEQPIFKFENVSFSYKKGSKNTLDNLNFAILPGSSVGIIGGTGSGKSTTIALLERLYDPNKGHIYFNGSDIKDVDLDYLRSNLSLVSQKPAIFKGTIRSNLLLAKPQASEEELVQALKDSLAYEYVNRYKDKLDHEVEENGANLSGGQKQRLLIARALLKNSSVLILDDSLSALDYLSDKTVRSNISKRENLTKIIISQRATTLSSCDQIFVFDNGKIVDQGTHDELLRHCKIYQEIYALQVANQ